MQKIQGFVEAGNTVLTISGAAGTISRKVQGSYPSATITVYLAGTVTLAPTYSDNSGTVKANPFTAASDGTWFAYIPNGSYDVKFSGGSIASPFTIGAIQAYDESILNIDVTSQPYFATGNGSTDDYAALQAAVTAVGAAGGGTVTLGIGKTYKTTQTLIFNSSNV